MTRNRNYVLFLTFDLIIQYDCDDYSEILIGRFRI